MRKRAGLEVVAASGARSNLALGLEPEKDTACLGRQN